MEIPVVNRFLFHTPAEPFIFTTTVFNWPQVLPLPVAFLALPGMEVFVLLAQSIKGIVVYPLLILAVKQILESSAVMAVVPPPPHQIALVAQFAEII
jgi:hypothetical protein